MKITRVRVYSVTLPPRTDGYNSGSGFLPPTDTSVVVLIYTDAGITDADGTRRSARTTRPPFQRAAAAGIA